MIITITIPTLLIVNQKYNDNDSTSNNNTNHNDDAQESRRGLRGAAAKLFN